MPITILDDDGNPKKVVAVIQKGLPVVHEPYTAHSLPEDDEKEIIKGGWLQDEPDG
tara:strand:+ start:2849 stop:3016 length:168 start_codon:yes stop_codon:yes gene_type:complete